MTAIDVAREKVQEFKHKNQASPSSLVMGSLFLAWIKEESWTLYHDAQPYDRKKNTLFGIPVVESFILKETEIEVI